MNVAAVVPARLAHRRGHHVLLPAPSLVVRAPQHPRMLLKPSTSFLASSPPRFRLTSSFILGPGSLLPSPFPFPDQRRCAPTVLAIYVCSAPLGPAMLCIPSLESSMSHLAEADPRCSHPSIVFTLQ
ncbi:hypothetical protein VTO73DRAFT_6349 [Trametes versicolor]